MYLMVEEGEHYDFVQGEEHEQQWFVKINFGKFKDSVLSYSDIEVDGKTGQMNFHMDMISKPENTSFTVEDDELQLIGSSILQNILLQSVVERTGRFIDVETGELIGY